MPNIKSFHPYLRWIDRNIFLVITLCFVLGIVTAHARTYHVSPSFNRYATLVFAVSSFLVYLKQKTSSFLSLFLILPFFFLLGNLVLLHRIQEPKAAGHIASLIQERQQVTLVGTLDTMVEERQFQQDGQKEISSQFEMQAEEVLLHRDGAIWQPVHGRVRLSIRGKTDNLQPGMRLVIPARAGPVLNFQTPGVFDYQGYLAAKGIHIKGWVIGEQVTVLREQEENSFRKMIHALCAVPEQLRQQVSRFLSNNLPGPIAGTYQALLIGSRAGVSQEIQEHFKATGTMHLLAISGLHMGLLALMVGAIISRILKCSEQLLLRTHVPTLTLLASLPILLGYSLIAGMNTPALRALIMTIIFFAAIIQRRQHSLPHLLAAAALIVLVRNPLALFTASFQLSFSAVAALIVFLPAILPSPAKNDRAGKKEHAVKQNWLARCWQRFILPAFLLSVTATLGTLPFMLFHFHRFSLVGPVMNLLVEPFLCFWALPWGLVAILFLFIAPDIALVLFKIGGLGIQAGHWCVALASTQPWASVWTITPTKAEMLWE